MFLSCPLVLVITLAVNVQSGPAVGVTHEFLHHFYPFAFLDQERCKRMAQGLLVLLMICTQQKFAIGSIPCMASKLM